MVLQGQNNAIINRYPILTKQCISEDVQNVLGRNVLSIITYITINTRTIVRNNKSIQIGVI